MRDLNALLSGVGFCAAGGGMGALYPTAGGIALALLFVACGLGLLMSRDADRDREIEELTAQLLDRTP